MMDTLVKLILLWQICLPCVLGSLSPEDIERIDDFAEEVLTCNNVPGMTLAVVHQGEAVLTRGYGVSNLSTNESMTDEHMFVIASVTKSMSCAVLAKLLEDTPGVDWDTTVRSIIGDDFYFSDSYRTNVSSIRDLVAHKMAVPRHDMIWHFDQFSTEELVERIRFFEPEAPFRTGDYYNNLMYGIAGYVTEILGGGHWKDLMKTHLFDPLGMTATHIIDDSVTDHSDYAVAYADRFGVRFPVPFELFNSGRSVGAMGMVVSNAKDMTKWLNFMLSGGKNEDGEQIIDTDVLNAVFTPEMALDRSAVAQRPEDPVTMTGHETYAKGWRNGYYNGFEMRTHGGYFPEYSSQQSIYPDLDIGIFTSYTGAKDFDNLLQHAFIVDLINDEEPWLEYDDLCPAEDQRRNKKKYLWNEDDFIADNSHFDIGVSLSNNFSRPIEDYVGTYGRFSHGNVTVFSEDDELFFTYGNLGHFQLLPTETADYFIPIGRNRVSLIREIDFVFFFTSPGVIVDHVRIGYPEEPVFFRDSLFSDAPPPPEPHC